MIRLANRMRLAATRMRRLMRLLSILAAMASPARA